jgi:hypothetical protein
LWLSAQEMVLLPERSSPGQDCDKDQPLAESSSVGRATGKGSAQTLHSFFADLAASPDLAGRVSLPVEAHTVAGVWLQSSSLPDTVGGVLRHLSSQA